MTAVSPPLYWSAGVPFNEIFWATSTGALSQTTANTLYLRKTVADTATVLETFSGGIQSNSLATVAITDNLDLATTQTSGTLNIGTLGTRTGSIAIGGGTCTTTMYGTTAVGTLRTGSIDNSTALAIGATATSTTLGNSSNATSIIGSNASSIAIGSGTLACGTIGAGGLITASNGLTVATTKALTVSGTGTTTLGTGTFTVNAPITLGYSSVPTSGQIGSSLLSGVLTTTACNSSASNTTIGSFTLPVGVWACSYVVRLISSGSTIFTAVQGYMQFSSVPTGYPTIYGSSQNPTTQTVGIVGSQNVSVTGSSIITATSSTTLFAYVGLYYTGTIPDMYGAAVPQSYLMATRIA